MLNDLSVPDRLKLMKFVCSFAWADLEIRPEERQFIGDLMHRLELGPDEELQVHRWLEVPPALESVDPTAVPREHRQAFLDEISGLIRSDGEIADEELENFAIFRQLVD